MRNARLAGISAAMVMLVAGMAMAAAARGWPTEAVIRAAESRVKYRDSKATATYKGHRVEFHPCDVEDIAHEVRDRGMILGKLTLEGHSPDKLPPGTYFVFAWKKGDQWEVFFTKNHEPVAKSTEVKHHEEKKEQAHWEVDNTAIRYWKVRFAY